MFTPVSKRYLVGKKFDMTIIIVQTDNHAKAKVVATLKKDWGGRGSILGKHSLLVNGPLLNINNTTSGKEKSYIITRERIFWPCKIENSTFMLGTITIKIKKNREKIGNGRSWTKCERRTHNKNTLVVTQKTKERWIKIGSEHNDKTKAKRRYKYIHSLTYPKDEM